MPTVPTHTLTRSVLLAVALLATGATVSAADPKAGEQLYRQHCVRCHGPTGEGTKKHPTPLVGDKPLAELAKVIDKTMPEDDPDKLDAAQSADVAAYITDAFYSPTAQARIRPARIELSRLTVAQYRNAIADVVGSFRPAPPKWDDTRGLRGEYYNARGFQQNKRLITRTDPGVKFDFGTKGPDPEKFEAHQFAIRWEGSVLAPETGTYEFVVRTEHATRLWVNDRRTPLIDAWVKSGNDTEYRAPVMLLAGRTYQLVLEFSKAKQGVDDSKKNPNPPSKPASVALLWKPPHGTTEVIPARQLSLPRPAEVFVVSTPFPPDDRSLGWERGTTISKEWDAATTDAALETSRYVVGHLAELSGVSDGDKERGPKLKEFCRRFAERAFRGPLAEEQKKAIDHQFETSADPETAVKRVVLLVLMSPRFLFREVGGAPAAFDTASRLSFALWDSPPDDELLKAAAAGKLATPEQVAAQAERMLADPRARAKVRAFLLTWLKLDQAHDLTKDAKRFPGFNPAVASDLKASLELFLDDVTWTGDSDFRKFLLADEVFLNGPLAKLYGADLPADAGFQKVKLDAGKRSGVLTHPYVLASFAYTADSSPIHRGVFVVRGILGVTLRPPPDAFTPFAADLHPTLTTRERVALQTKPAACVACHGVINPLGFSLEHFDAIGRYREKDNGKPVDAAGMYKTKVGAEAKFAGAPELAKFLAGSGEVHAAFAEKLFHHLVKQPVRAYGPHKLDELRNGFVKDGYSVRKLIVATAVAGALPPKTP